MADRELERLSRLCGPKLATAGYVSINTMHGLHWFPRQWKDDNHSLYHLFLLALLTNSFDQAASKRLQNMSAQK